jgi:dCMP deaminase
MKDPRPTWDEWGLLVADTVSMRADCTRRRVGAVLLDWRHRIVATGYNGAPAGEKGCLTDGACPRGRASLEEVEPLSSYDTGLGSCIALHAEQNVVIRASWSEMDGATLYVTDRPCGGCFRTIQGTPIHRVVTPGWEWTRPLKEPS